MAFSLKRLFGFFTKSESGSVLLKLLDQNKGGDIEDNYTAYATFGYAGNPFVYACIREIATSASKVPWRVMRKSAQPKMPGTEVTDTSNPLNRLIKSPSKGQTWQQFLEELITHLEIGGEAFVRGIFVDNDSRIAQLQLLRPDRVEVKVKTVGLLQSRSYTYSLDGVEKGTFTDDEVLQVKFYNPLNDLRGLSPCRAIRHAIQSNNEARRWNKNLLQNDARPSGAFSVKGELQDSQIQAIREMINERFTNPANARRPLLLQGETRWINFGYSPGEMDWLGGLASSTREICSGLNVPEELVGGSRKTYENYEAALKGLYTENLLPLLDMIRGSLNLWLVPKVVGADTDYYLDYDKTMIDVLQDDADKLYKRANVATYMTIDERREIVGLGRLGPAKGGDVVLVSTASQTLETVMEGTVAPPAPPNRDQLPDPQRRNTPEP